MLGVLLESRARHQRRTGGAALSVAVHVAIIAAATAATVHGKSAPPERPKVTLIRFDKPPVDRPVEVHHVASASAPRSAAPSPVNITVVVPPTIVPVSIQPFDMTHGLPSDSIVIGSSAGNGHSGLRNTLDVDDAPSDGEWRGNELMMRIVSSAKPRYPETLRQTGIAGRVLVRFTVDTLGRVDMTSVQILQSTHDLFTRAVRDALPGFRFKPSEVRGKRVASLAEMPFEFTITK